MDSLVLLQCFEYTFVIICYWSWGVMILAGNAVTYSFL